MKTLKRWMKLRRLSRYQVQCWPEASYLNDLYTLLHIITTFQTGLQKVMSKEA